MASITRLLGVGLIILGVVAYVATEASSPTALLPAALGLVLAVLGFVAGREHLRKHAMHAAMALALIGLLGTAMNLADVPQLFAGTAERPAAVVTSAITAVALAVYLAFGIRSFVAARGEQGAS